MSPFRWNRTLVALRTVATPEGELAQGFQLSRPALEAWLKDADPTARLEQGTSSLRTSVPLPVEGLSLHVSLSPLSSRSGFLRTFLAGSSLAVLSGLCLVGLVWQTERLARQRSQFAASAAHELRTPLAGLRMYGEMLAEGLGEPARAKDYARRVADEAERLGRVVGNVLGFTRLERGTLSVKPEPGDLAAAVREAAARLKPSIEAAGARLEIDIPATPVLATFDRDAIAQILQNLLDNAEKYARSCPDRTVRVSLSPGRELSVSDRGPGIPPRLRKRLFRAFSRGQGPDQPAGMGLGLALSQALAKAQGGEITCAGTPGGGATFTLRLPS